jgi:NAD(P)H dehydrogenase (quinone)
MHSLAVFAHPMRNSFTGEVLDAFTSGMDSAGHTIEVADLHREGFQPIMTVADYAQYRGDRMPDDVLAEQARVERVTGGVALIFPIYWWGFPAVLKGWFDRVWCAGWAWQLQHNPADSVLRARPFTILACAGSDEEGYRKRRYDEMFRHLIEVGFLSYCGVRDTDFHVFYEVVDAPHRRAGYLEVARQAGMDLAGRTTGVVS